MKIAKNFSISIINDFNNPLVINSLPIEITNAQVTQILKQSDLTNHYINVNLPNQKNVTYVLKDSSGNDALYQDVYLVDVKNVLNSVNGLLCVGEYFLTKTTFDTLNNETKIENCKFKYNYNLTLIDEEIPNIPIDDSINNDIMIDEPIYYQY